MLRTGMRMNMKKKRNGNEEYWEQGTRMNMKKKRNEECWEQGMKMNMKKKRNEECWEQGMKMNVKKKRNQECWERGMRMNVKKKRNQECWERGMRMNVKKKRNQECWERGMRMNVKKKRNVNEEEKNIIKERLWKLAVGICVMRLRNDFMLKCSIFFFNTKFDALYLDLGDLKQSKSDGERREREIILLPSSSLRPPPHP